MPAPALISGLSDLAPQYDALICDIWGVVHDGHAPFLEACAALARFRAERGPVVLLTNAPRTAESVQEQFRAIGVPDDCYDSLITSGDAARADLAARGPGASAPAGATIKKGASAPAGATKNMSLYYIGPERDLALFAGLPVTLTGIGEAELALTTGLVDDLIETPDDYSDILAAMRARGLTMICANPDLKVHRGTQLCWCAGALARDYEAIGGDVVYYGKPRLPVYDLARQALPDAKNILAIGDGLVTDIRGANAAGLDVLFIADGVHGEEIEPYTPEHLEQLFAGEGVHARAACRALKW